VSVNSLSYISLIFLSGCVYSVVPKKIEPNYQYSLTPELHFYCPISVKVIDKRNNKFLFRSNNHVANSFPENHNVTVSSVVEWFEDAINQHDLNNNVYFTREGEKSDYEIHIIDIFGSVNISTTTGEVAVNVEVHNSGAYKNHVINTASFMNYHIDDTLSALNRGLREIIANLSKHSNASCIRHAKAVEQS